MTSRHKSRRTKRITRQVPALQREAERLLARLLEPDLSFAPDLMAKTERFILSKRQRGVSVSCGTYSKACLNWLVSQGCLEWQANTPSVFHVTDAGQARLRRVNAASAAYETEGFREQHLEIVLKPDEKSQSVQIVNESESPLAWLARRKGRDGQALISAVQFQAGERLRADMTLAAMVPRTTVNWQSLGSASGGQTLTHSELVTAARQRVQNALAVVGAEMNGVLMDLCGFLKGLEQIERERNWPPRSGKVVIGLALDRLASHYGLAASVQGPDQSRMRQWGAADYRPVIS